MKDVDLYQIHFFLHLSKCYYHLKYYSANFIFQMPNWPCILGITPTWSLGFSNCYLMTLKSIYINKWQNLTGISYSPNVSDYGIKVMLASLNGFKIIPSLFSGIFCVRYSIFLNVSWKMLVKLPGVFLEARILSYWFNFL